MITAGVDCGAKTTKTIVLDDGRIIGMSCVPTGFDQQEAVNKSLSQALERAGLAKDRIDKMGGTGSGAKSMVDADVKVTDIKSIGAAAFHLFPNCRTVVDVGAEASRCARFNETGTVEDFALNEKCAAGAGAFIEAMSRALEISPEEIGSLALTSDKSIPMNAQCAIFAESEVVGLIHARTPRSDICKAILDAIGGRIVSMIRRIGVTPDVCVLGGVARNQGFVEALRRQLGLERIYIPQDPEYGAALGAAIVAARDAK